MRSGQARERWGALAARRTPTRRKFLSTNDRQHGTRTNNLDCIRSRAIDANISRRAATYPRKLRTVGDVAIKPMAAKHDTLGSHKRRSERMPKQYPTSSIRIINSGADARSCCRMQIAPAQGRPADEIPCGLRQTGRALRRPRCVLCLGHPAVQHHDLNGPADAQCAVVLCSVRAPSA